MSYILDALRRSQAERERGQVPGLNAQPASAGAAAPALGGAPQRWAVPLALLALVGVAALTWWWMRPAATPLVAAQATPATAAPAATTPAQPALPMVVSAPAPVAPSPVPATVVPVPSTVPPPMAAPPAAAAVAPPPVPAAPAGPRSLKLAELSAEQRRDWPPLAMGGSIWSESVLARFVIINGQVVREGESAAPGVVVERIGPKAVWLRWRDLRVEVPL